MDYEVESDFRLIPPSPERVARRAFVLAAVVCRSGLESDAGNPEAERFRAGILEWLSGIGIADELEADERALLDAPLGSLTERQVIDASWRGEGLAVLAWSLGRFDLPPYGQIVSSPDAADSIGFLEPDGLDLLSPSSELRDPEEIEKFAELMLSAHWRLRQYSLDGEAMNFAEFARTCYFGPLETEGLEFAASDLAVGGHPLSEVSEDEWREVMSIVRERHEAANWLIGQDPAYSEITCDT